MIQSKTSAGYNDLDSYCKALDELTHPKKIELRQSQRELSDLEKSKGVIQSFEIVQEYIMASY